MTPLTVKPAFGSFPAVFEATPSSLDSAAIIQKIPMRLRPRRRRRHPHSAHQAPSHHYISQDEHDTAPIAYTPCHIFHNGFPVLSNTPHILKRRSSHKTPEVRHRFVLLVGRDFPYQGILRCYIAFYSYIRYYDRI